MTTRVERTIDVDVPVRVAYDQWTQFERFPQFMDGVHRVVQHEDRTLDWTVMERGLSRSWTARIVEQHPDRLIEWRPVDGAGEAGTVRFEALDPVRTRIHLCIENGDSDEAEQSVDGLGSLDRRVTRDLGRFKTFIEGRHGATGAWRSEIHEGRPMTRGG